MIEKTQDDLDIDSRDVAVKTISGLLGALPGLGPLMANMFEISIPGTRMDRLVDTMRRVESKVDDLEDFREKMNTPEGMDYIEEVLTQTRTALTEERREYIANIFRNSVNREDVGHIWKKDLFRILSELNDIEILHLKLHSLRLTLGQKHPFLEKHMDVLRPVTRSTGATPEDRRSAAFEDLYIKHLESLGLISVETRNSGRSKRINVTQLGDMLIEYIEVPED